MENKEDIEVSFGEETTFIQVKGKKLSLSELAKTQGEKHSIIAKNLQKSDLINSRFKIATLDLFSKLSGDLEKTSSNKIFGDGLYRYTEKSKAFLIKKLLEEKIFTKDEISSKLERSYIVITPFPKSLPAAQTYLLGEMNKNGICVDNHQGIIALNELCNQIDQRSEIIASTNEELNKKKSFTSLELKKIFLSQNHSDMFEQILNEVKDLFSLFEREQIKRERLKILSHYKNIKNQILLSLSEIDISGDIKTIITPIYEANISLGKKETVYAIIIDCLADRMEEILSK